MMNRVSSVARNVHISHCLTVCSGIRNTGRFLVGHQNSRQFSIFGRIQDSFADSFTSGTERKIADSFRDQMLLFAETPVYTMPIFRDQLEREAKQGGVMGWRSYLPGAAGPDKPEAKEIQLYLKISDAIVKATQDGTNVEALPHPIKRKVALVAECDVSDVNILIRRFALSKSLHGWVQKRKQSGKPIPISREEFSSAAAADPIKYSPSVTRFLKDSKLKELKRKRR